MKSRNEYPRPLLQRDAWQDLSGEWEFAFDDEDRGLTGGWPQGFAADRTIRVPFSYETRCSGIGDPAHHPVLWYQKTIDLSSAWGSFTDTETLLLHFEGADFETAVWANGRSLGTHRGGYERFSFDLADLLPAETLKLVIRVSDSCAQDQPRGKQRWKKESWACWYVQTSGIWKTVWLEKAPKQRLEELAVRSEENRIHIYARIRQKAEARLLLSLTGPAGESIPLPALPVHGEEGERELEIPDPRFWTPEDPALYTLRAVLVCGGREEDRVQTYFGLRDIGISGEGLLLNKKRVFLRLILDQGYWKESGLTPPSLAALQTDLDAVKRYGYNGLRKHQKTEDERFLRLCDEQGILVFSEMAAEYTFTEEGQVQFLKEWTQIVRQFRGHPCVIAWVPFNESWGIPGIRNDPAQQAFVREVYRLTKELDPTRPVITNDGWEHLESDILTIHDYRETGRELLEIHGDKEAAVLAGERSYSWYGQYLLAEGVSYRGQPLMLSEYGGIAFVCEDGWGYGNQVKDEEAFLERFLGQNEAIRKLLQFSGFCYTQLTDVEQEKNGLLTAERRDKLSPGGVAAVRDSNQSFR